MNHTEAAFLCRYVKAACPQQHFDEFTPDTWHDILGDLRLEDCKAAVAAIANQLDFIAPSDIRKGVRVIRDERLRVTPIPEPPPDIGADELAYRRWLAVTTRRIADGETVAPVAALKPRDMAVIEATFQEVPPA